MQASPTSELSHADYLSGLELVRQFAPYCAISEDALLDALGTVPEDMLPFLTFPSGWSALASFIAADFGLALNDYRPTIH